MELTGKEPDLELAFNHSYCQKCNLHFNGFGCPGCHQVGKACSCLDGKAFVPTHLTMGILPRHRRSEAVALLPQNPKYYECRPPFEFEETEFRRRKAFRCKGCGEHFSARLHFGGWWIRPEEVTSG